MKLRYPYQTGADVYSDLKDGWITSLEPNEREDGTYEFIDPLTMETIYVTPDSDQILYRSGNKVYTADGIREYFEDNEENYKRIFKFVEDIRMLDDFVKWATCGAFKVQTIDDEAQETIKTLLFSCYKNKIKHHYIYDEEFHQPAMFTYVELYFLDEFLEELEGKTDEKMLETVFR